MNAKSLSILITSVAGAFCLALADSPIDAFRTRLRSKGFSQEEISELLARARDIANKGSVGTTGRSSGSYSSGTGVASTTATATTTTGATGSSTSTSTGTTTTSA